MDMRKCMQKAEIRVSGIFYMLLLVLRKEFYDTHYQYY